MSDASSEYVALLDDVEHIPLAAREPASLSTEERAAVMARVVPRRPIICIGSAELVAAHAHVHRKWRG